MKQNNKYGSLLEQSLWDSFQNLLKCKWANVFSILTIGHGLKLQTQFWDWLQRPIHIMQKNWWRKRILLLRKRSWIIKWSSKRVITSICRRKYWKNRMKKPNSENRLRSYIKKCYKYAHQQNKWYKAFSRHWIQQKASLRSPIR